jgi:glycosyltransferase involved in cell wall biosynthesis
MTPLVSIVVITYKQAAFIAQNLDGLLMQETNFPFEIIVSEDCSPDNTKEIVQQYADKHPAVIKFISRTKNVGAIINAQEAIYQCKGKYLAFCEGDDFWNNPNKLQTQVDFLESHLDFALVHTDVNLNYEDTGNTIYNNNQHYKINFPSGLIFENYLMENLFIQTCTVLVRKEIFIKSSDYDFFAKKNWLLQDLPTWLEIAANYKIQYLPNTTATYRLSSESASRTSDVYKQFNFHLSVYSIRFYFWRKYSKKLAHFLVLYFKFFKVIINYVLKTKKINHLKYLIHI